MTEQEITKFLEKYCPGTIYTTRGSKPFVENEKLNIYEDINDLKNIDESLTLIAYEYAFVKYAMAKFERLEFPTHVYRCDTEPHVEFSLCGQAIQCDVAISLIRIERKYFELTLDSGLCIRGQEKSDHVDSLYEVTLSRIDEIDPRCSVEYVQELARDLVDDMFEQLSKYELRKD